MKTIILEAIFVFCVEQATKFSFNELFTSEKGLSILKRAGLDKLPNATDFDGFYKYTFFEYSMGRENNEHQKAILYLLQDRGIQKAFRTSFEDGNSIVISECVETVYEAEDSSGKLSALTISEAKTEVATFREIFDRIVRKSRPLHMIQDQQKRDEQFELLRDELQAIKESLNNSQPTVTELSSLTASETPKTPTGAYYHQLALLEDQLAVTPSDVNLLTQKAVLHYQQNNMEAALGTINRAWELDKSSIDVMNARACIITDYASISDSIPKSMLVEAVKLFEQVRPHVEGNQAGILYNIGNAYQYMREYDEALNQYELALSLVRNDGLASEIYTNMGNTYVAKEEYEEAVIAFQKALERYVYRWQALSSWGELELKLGNHLKASQLFNQLLKVNPDVSRNSASHCYALSFAYWSLEEYEKSYHWVNQVLHINPTHANAKLLKAYLLANLWEIEDQYIYAAISFFEAMRIDEPDSAFAAHILHLIYSSEGYRDKARLIIDESVLPQDAPPFVCYDYAMFLHEEGNLGEAIRWLTSAISRDQSHHIAHQLAKLEFRAGAYEDAILHFRIAIKDGHHVLGILQEGATCYMHIGNHLMALLLMMKAVSIEPMNPVWWNNIAYTLKELGKRRLMPSPRFIKILEKGHSVSMETIQAYIDVLLEDLENEFGEKFVKKIRSQQWMPE